MISKIRFLFYLLFVSPVYCFGQTSSFPTYDKDLLSPEFFKNRREALREKLPDSSMCILFSAPERNRSNDVYYTYQQDPNFYYLTGITEPNAVLIIYKMQGTPTTEQSGEYLFLADYDKKNEQWNGRQPDFNDATKISGISRVKSTTEFQNSRSLFTEINYILRLRFPKGMVDTKRDEQDLYSLVEQFKLNSNYPSVADDDFKLGKIINELREVKQIEEQERIRKAIDITCTGHLEMMRALETGFSEYKIQAVGEYIFKSEGAEATGYPSICGGGENSCYLHYETNRKPLESGDLILLDMGAEYHGYSADITRTLPVNGKFTAEQKEIYEIIYNAQEAAFEACKPGNAFRDPHQRALDVITNGLIQLGIIKDESEVKSYFMHGTSHYLGLDVHDVGTYSNLKAGNIITVEPGIYIPEGSPCDPRWWNIGIRLEEDVLITKDGYEVLSARLPRKWEEIEKVMAEKSFFNK